MELIKSLIVTVALEEGLRPEVLDAIVFVESSYNVEAVGSLGEMGLTQLRPEFHECASFDPETNLRCAAKYLKKHEKRGRAKYGRCWWLLHNVGPYRDGVDPRNHPYAKKVKKHAQIEKCY